VPSSKRAAATSSSSVPSSPSSPKGITNRDGSSGGQGGSGGIIPHLFTLMRIAYVRGRIVNPPSILVISLVGMPMVSFFPQHFDQTTPFQRSQRRWGGDALDGGGGEALGGNSCSQGQRMAAVVLFDSGGSDGQ
jgi:hypothetical protein